MSKNKKKKLKRKAKRHQKLLEERLEDIQVLWLLQLQLFRIFLSTSEQQRICVFVFREWRKKRVCVSLMRSILKVSL